MNITQNQKPLIVLLLVEKYPDEFDYLITPN